MNDENVRFGLETRVVGEQLVLAAPAFPERGRDWPSLVGFARTLHKGVAAVDDAVLRLLVEAFVTELALRHGETPRTILERLFEVAPGDDVWRDWRTATEGDDGGGNEG